MSVGGFEATVSERTREGLAMLEVWTDCGTILRRSAGKLCMSYPEAAELEAIINVHQDCPQPASSIKHLTADEALTQAADLIAHARTVANQIGA